MNDKGFIIFVFIKRMTDQVKKYAILFGNLVMLPLIYFRLGDISREIRKSNAIAFANKNNQ